LILGAVDFIFFFGSGRLFLLFDDIIWLMQGEGATVDLVVFIGSFVQLALIFYAVTLVVMHYQKSNGSRKVIDNALKTTHPSMVTVVIPKYLLYDPIPDTGVNLGLGFERFIGEPKTESEYYKQFPDIEEIMKDINKVTDVYAKYHPDDNARSSPAEKNDTVSMFEILNGPQPQEVETAEQFAKIFFHQQPLNSN
jgi:hypothetical protein